VIADRARTKEKLPRNLTVGGACYADIATGNGRPPGDWRRYFDDFGKPITELL
jgi:hypothetical protein